MTIELRAATAEDVPELGRICYEAFKDISERHGFQTDFPSVEYAQGIVGLLVQQEAVYNVAAFDGGAPRASNFMSMFDDVGGIGPVSVDITSQGQGIGKSIMEDVLAHGKEQGFDMIRLCQDGFNMQSLALYASLGFDTVEPIALMTLSNAGPANANVRPATADDVPAMDELTRSIYRISRKEEIALFMTLGFPTLVLDRGHVAGYLIVGPAGHGVAETDDDLVALYTTAGAGGEDAQAFVPLRNGELYRKTLAAGHRNRKVMNLMALGPYEEPRGTFCPSVFF